MTEAPEAYLIKRLRDRHVCSLAHNSCRNDFAMEQAADTLSAISAEHDALRGAVKLLRDMHCIPWDDGSEVVLRICNRALDATKDQRG